MKKIFLTALLAAQVLTGFAQSQDFKPYEEKMNKLYAEFTALNNEYAALRQKDPKTMTDADKQSASWLKATRSPRYIPPLRLRL